MADSDSGRPCNNCPLLAVTGTTFDRQKSLRVLASTSDEDIKVTYHVIPVVRDADGELRLLLAPDALSVRRQKSQKRNWFNRFLDACPSVMHTYFQPILAIRDTQLEGEPIWTEAVTFARIVSESVVATYRFASANRSAVRWMLRWLIVATTGTLLLTSPMLLVRLIKLLPYLGLVAAVAGATGILASTWHLPGGPLTHLTDFFSTNLPWSRLRELLVVRVTSRVRRRRVVMHVQAIGWRAQSSLARKGGPWFQGPLNAVSA